MASIPKEILEYANYLISLIKKSTENHPLKTAYKNKSSYFCNFIDFMIHLHKELSDTDCNAILIDKLQLSKSEFDENQYYEAATELTVIFHLYCIKHTRFEYEKTQKKGTDKQPECAVFSSTGCKFIAEAKCPVQENTHITSNQQQTLIFKNAGRANSKDEQKSFLDTMNADLSSQNVVIKQAKNTDNKMLDFLQSASLKFADETNNNELNILFVALDSVNQIQEWVNYFYYNKGFFTTNSFAAEEPYCYADRKNATTFVEPYFKNVHFIVFTNNCFRHKNNSNIEGSAWKLNESFNFALQNPFADLVPKKEAIQEFFSYLGVYTKDIQNYKMDCVPNTPADVLDSVKIITYVKKELEEKQCKYYWSKL